MTVRVLFFSSLADIAGCGEVERSFPGRESMTVGELLDALTDEWPALKEWDERLLVAVDLEYAGRDEPVRDGQEVAVMPPVQGG